MVFGKALILAGSRLDDRPWPAASGTPKHLFPVANRPILFHNLEALRATGVHAAAIVADAASADAIARAVGDGRDWDLTLTVAECSGTGGLREALAAAGDFVGADPVLVQRGDAVLRARLQDHFAVFERERLDALALRLSDGVASTVPAPAPGYLFSPRAVSMLRAGGRAASPIAGVRAQGGRVRVEHVEGMLTCHGDQECLLATNRALLEGLRTSYAPDCVRATDIQGQVEIHPTAVVERSTLRGPLIVGPHARVTGSYIGPYTSIGEGVEIEGAEIEHSIVLPEARIGYAGTRIESSVIGRGARVTRSFQLPSALRLTLGENAELVLA